MALIPHCRASGKETRTRITYVLQFLVEKGITTLPREILENTSFQKWVCHLYALKYIVKNYKIDIVATNKEIKIYFYK